MRMHLGAGLAGAVLIGLSVTGCTENDSSTPPSVTGPPSTVGHPPAAVPVDRDKRAVVAALRQLDACALLDPAAAAVPGYPANVRPWSQGPHQCLITRKRGDDQIKVKLGEQLGAPGKFDQALLNLNGVKAYLATPRAGDECSVRIPVSFELAIELYAIKGSQSTGGDLCAAVQGFAAAATTKLVNPDTITAGDTMPLAQWDACSLLAAALGPDAERLSLQLYSSHYGIDECGPKITASAGSLKPEMRLNLEYQRDPTTEPGMKTETIGGKAVRVYESNRCYLAWSQGPSRSADPQASHQRVQLDTPTCTTGKPLAESLIKVLGSPPPASPAPVRPVIYRPDEPDVAVPGGCVDLGKDLMGSCQPYVAVTVPRGAAEILRAAKADPNVDCAVAIDAVRTHFGDQLTPVTSGGSCVFVEPTHSVHIEIASRRDSNLDHHDGDNQDNARNHRKLTLSGRPAAYYEYQAPQLDPEYHLNVAPNTTSGDGVVFGTITFYPTRGTPETAPAETSRSTKLEAVMADITATFFA